MWFGFASCQKIFTPFIENKARKGLHSNCLETSLKEVERWERGSHGEKEHFKDLPPSKVACAAAFTSSFYRGQMWTSFTRPFYQLSNNNLTMDAHAWNSLTPDYSSFNQHTPLLSKSCKEIQKLTNESTTNLIRALNGIQDSFYFLASSQIPK